LHTFAVAMQYTIQKDFLALPSLNMYSYKSIIPSLIFNNFCLVPPCRLVP